MKKLKKVLLIVMNFMIMLTVYNVNVFASSTIPNEMESNTLIKYVSDSKYVVLTEDEKDSCQYNDEQFKEVVTDDVKSSATKVIVEDYPDPCEGLYVQYGSDGYVSKIYTLKNQTVKAKVSIKNSVQTKGVSDPSYSTVASWGSYPNYLYKGIKNYDYLYYGKGRATTFNDTTGQKDHKLVKGDVATKLKYDNCAYGTTVLVTLPKKSGKMYTKKMLKRDAGGMPNAIVDIWKTGVEYWGYSYSSNLSIGNATIKHN